MNFVTPSIDVEFLFFIFPIVLKDSWHSGVQKHPLRPYLEYVGFLYQRMDPLPEQERFEVSLSLCVCMHTCAWVRFSVCLCPCVFGMYMFPSYYLCLTLLISYASLDTGISCSHLYRCCVFAYCSVVLFFISIFKKDFFYLKY